MKRSFYEEYRPIGEVTYDKAGPDLDQRIQENFLHRYNQREKIDRFLKGRGTGLRQARNDLSYLRFGKIEHGNSALSEIALCDCVSSLGKAGMERFEARDKVRYEANGSNYLRVYDVPGDILNQPVVLFFTDYEEKRIYGLRELIEISGETAGRIIEFCGKLLPVSHWNSDVLSDLHYRAFIRDELVPFEVHCRVIKNLDHVTQFLDFIEELLEECS